MLCCVHAGKAVRAGDTALSRYEGRDDTLGGRVRAARHRGGLSAAELARLSGVTQGAISQIEGGSRQPSKDLLFRIAEVTRTTAAELLGAEVGTFYAVGKVDVGVLQDVPVEQWPDFLRQRTPDEWPGTLRSFIASVGADMMELVPDEVPLLARMARIGGAPMDEAGWVRQLSYLRMLVGSKGRPVVLEMVQVDDDASDAP